MQPVEWMLSLQNKISTEKARMLVRAFIHEPLVIGAMQQDGFLEEVFQRGEAGSVADLALAAMDNPLRAAELREAELRPIPVALRASALQIYEFTHKTLTAPANLEEAGLLALALRERYRMTKGWHGLVNELTQGELSAKPGLAYEIWKTPLACLFQMVPDGLELCQTLVPRQKLQPGARWVSHILLSNPLEESEQARLFTLLMRKVSPVHQTAWLRELSLAGEAELVMEISRELLASTMPLVEKNTPLAGPAQRVVDEVLRQALELQHLAELYQLNGQVEEAEQTFLQVQRLSKTWLAGIHIQLAGVSLQGGKNDQAQNHAALAHSLSAGDEATSSDLMLWPGAGWQPPLEWAESETVNQHPLANMLRAEELGRNGSLAAGQAVAKEALEKWLEDLINDPLRQDFLYATEWKPERFTVAFIDLGLEEEAISFARAALLQKPGNEVLAGVLIDLLQKRGDLEAALEVAAVLASLHPASVGLQRGQAKLLNATQRWLEAYSAWKRTLELASTPEVDDWLGLSQASLEARDYSLAVELCERVLERDENHGMANGMLGRALLKSGQPQAAVPVLIKAAAICPESTQAWLDLAEAYRSIGDSQKVLETLRAAALSVMDSVEIYLGLGETCLEAGLQVEALPAFRKAAQLKPDSEQAAIQLSNILFSLGHLSEAQAVVLAARQRWPENPELAFIHARICLELGDRSTALQALEISLLTEKPEVERYTLLAETLMEGIPLGTPVCAENQKAVERATQVVETVLTWMPDHELGMILEGEIQLARGENQAAYDTFSRLSENNPSQGNAGSWRLLAGLGLAALRTGKVDLALSALQDAILIQPQMISLHRLLAEATIQAHQKVEGLQRARLTLKMAANDEENLLWFAELMMQADETAEAITAMQVLTQMAPERADLWLKRAGMEVENGDLAAAQFSLQTLLALSDLKHDQYRLAALTYLRMQDQTAAMACLDLAAEKSGEVTTSFLLEMTCLNFRLGRLEMAVENCLRVTSAIPTDGILQVLLADLLCGLGNWTQAITSLDRALEIWENGHRTGEIGRWQLLVNSGWMRGEWLNSANRLGMISLRKALIYQRLNEIDLAEQHLELALQQMENHLPAVYLAVEFALAKHDLERSTTLLEGLNNANPEFKGLQIENAYQGGYEATADQLLRTAMIDYPHDFRLRILQVRQLNRKFDWVAANSLFDRLFLEYRERKEILGSWQIPQTELMIHLVQRGDLLRLADLALDLRRWDVALELAEECVRVLGDAEAQLKLAKVLTVCAEQQRLYQEINISSHAPGIGALSEERRNQFELAMQKAGLESYQHENLRWFRRGRLAFQEGLEQIAELASVADNSADTVAVMAALRRNNNLEGVRDLSGQYPHQPAVLAELALAQMAADAPAAQQTAQHLAEINPSDPVHLGVLALIAGRNQDWTIALGALENALQIWQDEAEWHAWAAEMADQVNASRAALSHWEQAVALEPKRLGFILALGRACNLNKLYPKAVSVLKRAAEITTQHPEIWLELSRALQGTGEYSEALECAGKAADLLPEDTLPLILSGEIALAMGKVEWAFAYGQEAYKITNRDEKVVLFLAQVLEKRGKPAEGLALIEKSLANVVQSDALVYEEARLIRRIHGAKAALPVLGRLVNEKPGSVEALSLLAQVQADCGDLAAAEKSVRKALEINPEDPETNLLLGRLLHKAGQLDQAVIYLKLATTSPDHSIDALMELGRVYQARREFQAAMQMYQQAIMHSPQDHRPYLAAGAVLREAKDYRASEAMFRRAAELAPGDVNIQRQLGAVAALNLVYESQEVKFSYGQH